MLLDSTEQARLVMHYGFEQLESLKKIGSLLLKMTTPAASPLKAQRSCYAENKNPRSGSNKKPLF